MTSEKARGKMPVKIIFFSQATTFILIFSTLAGMVGTYEIPNKGEILQGYEKRGDSGPLGILEPKTPGSSAEPAIEFRGTRGSPDDFDILYRLGYGSMIGFLNSIKSADVDNDQKEELVYGNKEGSIFVMERDGTELKKEWVSPLLGGNSYGLALGDVDDDSIIEIVVGAADGIVRIYGWNGADFEKEWESPDLGNYAYGLDLGDVDDDGNMEIVVGTGEIMFDYDTEGGWVAGTGFSPLDENLFIFGFNGINYQQEWSTIIPALYDGTGIYNIAIGDTDNDGVNEIVIGTFEWEMVTGDFEGRYGILGWDNGYSYDWTIRELGNWIMGMGIGDTDDDGEMEIVIAVWDDAFYIYGYDSSAPEDIYRPEWQSSELSPFTLAVGDTDDDGTMEIVEAEEDSVNLYDFTGPGYSQTWTSGLMKEHVTGLGVGQMNGVPPNEVLVADDYNIFIYSKEGAGYSEQARVEGFGRIASIEANDINGNGVNELYLLSKKGMVTVLEAGLSGFEVTDRINIGDGESFTNILIRDFDGDGDMEIAVVEGNTSIKYSAGWLIRGGASSMTVTFVEYQGGDYDISDVVFIADQGTFSADAGDVDGDMQDEVVLGGTAGDLIVVGYNGDTYQVENLTHVSEDWINGIDIGDTDGDGNIEIGICNESDMLIVVGYDGNDYALEWEGELPVVIPLALEIASMDDDPEEEIFIKSAFTFDLVIQGWDGSGYVQEAILQGYGMTFEECLAVDEVLSESNQLVIGSLNAAMLEYSSGYSEIWSGQMMSSNALSLEVADVDGPSDTELSLAYDGMIIIYGDKIIPQAVLNVSQDISIIGEELIFDGKNSTGVLPLQYMFDFGDGNSTDWMSTSSISHSYSIAGQYTASLKVKDARSIESEDPATMIITVEPPNLKPIAKIDFISPDRPVQDESVYFQGHGEDDGTIIAYEWKSSKDGIISTESSFGTFTLSVGSHKIYFKVMDNKDVWSDADTQILRIDKKPHPPFATIDSITPNPAITGELVTFNGHGNDDDGTVTGYNWESDLDGFLSSKSFYESSTLSLGMHNISFTVRDNENLWSEPDVVTLIVILIPENVPPIAIIDSITPQEIKEGESVIFIGHGEDDDGVITDYYWESDIDGLLSDIRTFSISDLSDGTHVIYFRVKDDRDAWSEPDEIVLVVKKTEEEKGIFDLSSPARNPLPWILILIIVVAIITLILSIAGSRRKNKPEQQSYQNYYEVKSY